MQAFIKPFWQLGAYDQIAEKLKKNKGVLFPEADRHIQRAESKGNL